MTLLDDANCSKRLGWRKRRTPSHESIVIVIDITSGTEITATNIGASEGGAPRRTMIRSLGDTVRTIEGEVHQCHGPHHDRGRRVVVKTIEFTTGIAGIGRTDDVQAHNDIGPYHVPRTAPEMVNGTQFYVRHRDAET